MCDNTCDNTELNKIIENIFLIYKDKLKNYEYIDSKNIENIPLNTHIIYISKKNNYYKKGGFLKSIKDNEILHLFVSNKNWFIFINKFYFFYKLKKETLFKMSLQKLVDNNFDIKKIK